MRVGVVVIGRNEGRHLERSLRSALRESEAVVYADSASTDESPAVAERLGVPVVRLDASEPLSAARGRNAGRALLRELHHGIELIQFLDGDTELEHGWLPTACRFLQANPDVGVVAGRLRERFRDRNAFHRLADMEFDTETGDVDAIGGIAMYRAEAFDATGGFDPWVVSGEERELCSRMLAAGRRVMRLPETMAYHDIDMDNLGQWWRRAERSGQTYAEHWLDRGLMGRRVLSIAFWGGAVPASAFAMSLPSLGLSLGLLSSYAVLWRRVRRSRLLSGADADDAALYASAVVASKLPEMVGVTRLLLARLSRRPGAQVSRTRAASGRTQPTRKME